MYVYVCMYACMYIILSVLYFINERTHFYVDNGIATPTNITVTMITSSGASLTWDLSSSSSIVTSYLISYTTDASYTSGGSVVVSGGITSGILTNLEENTVYIITVQAITDNVWRSNSSEVIILTYTDGKSCFNKCVVIIIIRGNTYVIS